MSKDSKKLEDITIDICDALNRSVNISGYLTRLMTIDRLN
jgi:hypothetical protein